MVGRQNSHRVFSLCHEKVRANRRYSGRESSEVDICYYNTEFRRYPDYGVIVTGHSLGAAVCTLYGAMLRTSNVVSLRSLHYRISLSEFTCVCASVPSRIPSKNGETGNLRTSG
jgi:hypothetical protein